MACPRWGDGSKWGDGDKYCRQFGSTPYVAVLDENYGRLSLRITRTANADFYVDTLEAMATIRRMKAYRYQAVMDANTGERISARVGYATNAAFAIDSLRVVGQIRRQRLNG